MNSLKDEGAGFRYDTNKVCIITPQDETQYPMKSKALVAKDIVEQLAKIL